MNPVLRVGEARHPDHHHVGIVVKAGVLRLRVNALVEVGENAEKTGQTPAVLVVRHDGSYDIAAGPPDVCRRAAHVRRPSPGAVVPPVAKGKVEPVPGNGLSFGDCSGDLSVLNRRIEFLLVTAAPVHLHIVETPLGELQKVLLVMAFAANVLIDRAEVRVQEATVHSCIGVDAGLQSQAVNIAHDVGHVSRALPGNQRRPRLGIDHDVALRIALS